MAERKSVIGVDIEDSKFKEFMKMFTGYQEGLKEIPDSWKEINDTSGGAMKEFLQHANKANNSILSMVKAMDKVAINTKKSEKEQRRFTLAIGGSARMMKKLASHSKSVAHSIFGIGKFLLKLGAIGTGIGLFAGLFGVRALGEQAVSRQRYARGLGISTGQAAAFGVDYYRYVSPDMLSRIVEAKGNLSQRAMLALAAGTTAQQIATMRPDIIAQRVISHAHAWWKAQPPGAISAQSIQAAGFSAAGLGYQQMQRIGLTSGRALSTAAAQYAADQRMLNISNRVVSAWYVLTRQLHLVGSSLETYLIKKLVALSGPLSSFVKSVSQDARVLFNTILTPQAMNSFASAVKSFGTYLGSKDFANNIKMFGKAVVDFAKIVIGIYNWFFGTTSTGYTPKAITQAGNVLGGFRNIVNQSAPTKQLKAQMQAGTWGAPTSGDMTASLLSSFMKLQTQKTPQVHVYNHAPGFVNIQTNALGN